MNTENKYDLTHLAMVGGDGIPVFLIPSATPDQTINARRKTERGKILNAVNAHDALVAVAKAAAKLSIHGAEEAIKLAEGVTR